MRSRVIWALIACAFLSPTVAQQFLKGKCPQTPILKDFNWERYLGKWYEQERYFTFYQEIGECWTGTYLKNKKTGDVGVKLTFRDKILKKRQKIFVDVFAKYPYHAPNRLTYTVPGVPLFEDRYEVLSTDYDNYTIEYSCRNNPPFGHLKFAWILTRSPHPSHGVIIRAKRAMQKLGIDLKFLERSPQICYPKKAHHH